MRSAATRVAVGRADPLAVRRHRVTEVACPRGGGRRRRGARRSSNVVRRQPDTEPELVHPLGVVVLVPEQRQHDHRLAEVERLGRRVVPAVRDHQVARGMMLVCGSRASPHMFVGQLELVRARSLADDVAVRRLGQHARRAAASGPRRPSRASRGTGRRAPRRGRGAPSGSSHGVLGLADGRLEPVPGRRRRSRARIVRDRGDRRTGSGARTRG